MIFGFCESHAVAPHLESPIKTFDFYSVRFGYNGHNEFAARTGPRRVAASKFSFAHSLSVTKAGVCAIVNIILPSFPPAIELPSTSLAILWGGIF
jgi:hypothetical protein